MFTRESLLTQLGRFTLASCQTLTSYQFILSFKFILFPKTREKEIFFSKHLITRGLQTSHKDCDTISTDYKYRDTQTDHKDQDTTRLPHKTMVASTGGKTIEATIRFL